MAGLCDVSLVLRESAMALQYIHEAGWVHRDNTIGFFEECGLEVRGLIGDLAFTKKFTIDGSHQMRRHTLNFTAVEVLMGGYLFLPTNLSQSEIEERIKTNARVSLSRTPFVQNEAHDIESLWWIANYVLFFNRDNSVEETMAQEEDRLYHTEDIFPSSAFVNGRVKFLVDPWHYVEATSWFSSSFLELRDTLDKIRMSLTSCYSEFEGSFPNIARSAFDGLHRNAIKGFNVCSDKASNIAISSSIAKDRQRHIDVLQTPAAPPADPTANKAPANISEAT